MLRRFIQYYKPHKTLFFLDLAAAVLLAILFWSGGVFSSMVPDSGAQPSALTTALSWFSDGTASTMDKLTSPLHRLNDPIPYFNQQGDLNHE